MSVNNKKVYAGKFNSTALSVGGEFNAGDRSAPITVDKSNAQRQLRKPMGKASPDALNSFNMFSPLDGADNTTRKKGSVKHVHSDPFAADRTHYQAPIKRLLTVERNQDADFSAHRRHVEPPVRDGQDKEKVITANGLVGGGGKLQNGKHSSRTIFDQDATKPANYLASARFQKAAAIRQEGVNNNIISPNDSAKHAKGSNQGATMPGHGGIKRVGGSGDSSNSLVGVLRMTEPKKGRSYDYRPPWGTCNTPRTSTANAGHNNNGSSIALA